MGQNRFGGRPRSQESRDSVGVAILGAGPAGLTAGYVLASRNQPGLIYEADGAVGGIAKTLEYAGYRFDVGGQRLFTTLDPIRRLWEALLGDDLVLKPRPSGIYYRGSYLAYPVRPTDVLARLGPLESSLCALSYLAETCKPPRHQAPDNLEQWVTLRFGPRVYDAVFRPYTEKVWGLPGSDIQSQWGTERVSSLTWTHAVLGVMRRRGEQQARADEFHYPRLGPGQLWTAVEERIAQRGIQVRPNHRCVGLRHDGRRISHAVLLSDGIRVESRVDGVLSTLPLSELVRSLDPAPPQVVLEAAAQLRYRSMCVVALLTNQAQPFADTWIYLPDGATQAARVQNFAAWSRDMVRPGTTCLGVEYFCSDQDDIWHLRDADAVDFARAELGAIGLIDPAQVFGGTKVRVPAAYPLYDSNYLEAVETIRMYLARFENLQTCGRNGLHRHNNQDHSMWTAMLAMHNLLDGRAHDVWAARFDDPDTDQDALARSIFSGASPLGLPFEPSSN